MIATLDASSAQQLHIVVNVSRDERAQPLSQK